MLVTVTGFGSVWRCGSGKLPAMHNASLNPRIKTRPVWKYRAACGNGRRS